MKTTIEPVTTMNTKALHKQFEPYIDEKVRIEATVCVGHDYYGKERTKRKSWVGYIRKADWSGDKPVFMKSRATKTYYTLALKPEDVWDGHLFVSQITITN